MSRKNNKVDTTNEIKMGSPPAEGIGISLIRRAFGLSTIPVWTEIILNMGVSTKDNKIVKKNLTTILNETSILAPTLIKSLELL